MTAEDVKSMPVALKIQFMEILWDDLKDHFDRSDLTVPQKQLLDQRRQRAREGSARVFDWDAVKTGIPGA